MAGPEGALPFHVPKMLRGSILDGEVRIDHFVASSGFSAGTGGRSGIPGSTLLGLLGLILGGILVHSTGQIMGSRIQRLDGGTDRIGGGIRSILGFLQRSNMDSPGPTWISLSPSGNMIS